MLQRNLIAILSVAVLTAVFSTQSLAEESVVEAGVLNRKMTKLDGKEVNLAAYKGKVVLIVNVASKCGLTPQYTELQKLHEAHKEQGLAILGFPCNQFGGQEPGEAADIKQFCTENYGVTFDMFSKINVNGDDACDLYKVLTSTEAPPEGKKGKIKWNFEKFLIGRDGKVAARFAPRTKPSDEAVMKSIKAELAKQPSQG